MAKIVEGVVRNAWDTILDLTPWRYAGETTWTKPMLRVEVTAGKVPTRGTTVGVAVGKVERIRRSNCTFAWFARGKRPLRTVATAKPKIARHRVVPGLGKLVLDRDFSWFEGKGVTISVDEPDDDEHIDAMVAAGAKAIAAAKKLMPEVLDRAVAKLLPLYNRVWREADAKPLTDAKLRKTLKLESFDVTAKRTTLMFESGDLFSDHGVEVRIERGKIREILIS